MTTQPNSHPPLFYALSRLALLQRESVDRLELLEASRSASSCTSADDVLSVIAQQLQTPPGRLKTKPDESDLPGLINSPDGRWGILRARNAAGLWISDWFDASSQRWVEEAHGSLANHRFASVRLTPPYRPTRSPVLRLIVNELIQHKSILMEASIGGVLLAFLGMLISFYSMQVYDRVIPTGATQTLLVLTLGIAVTIAIEYAAKCLRARLYEQLIDHIDQRLARTVYQRFLSVRLDQLPASVGSLASQLRGYESVRGFLVTLSSHIVVDAPFAFFLLLVVATISGALAYIPFLFFLVILGLSLWHAGQIRQLSERSQVAANLKTGLLVESIEAAEIIKSGQGGWRMLSRWTENSDEARAIDLEMRNINELSQYRALAFQQIAYVLLIACGAWMASRGELTMGGLIACSILSGRILSPVTQLGTQITAWANVKAALRGLDAIWKLEDDHQGVAQPIYLESLRGAYRFEQVEMRLRGKVAIKVPQLVIHPGEKIGVLGPIGAGKSTLLRLLSGMFKPTEGRVWLDDVDLAHLSKPLVAENLGYLPQDGRLLGGSLRDNLILGLLDPGDQAILDASKATGLYQSVIAPHPAGLQQEIAEGGFGLSGGQRQLVNLTRVFLRKPKIWLLDEPTASLDRNLELGLITTFRQSLGPADTLILVTHKTEMLQLVDRLVVVANQQIILDGPRDAVLAHLKAGPTGSPQGQQERSVA